MIAKIPNPMAAPYCKNSEGISTKVTRRRKAITTTIDETKWAPAIIAELVKPLSRGFLLFSEYIIAIIQP